MKEKHKCRDCNRMTSINAVLCWKCALTLDFRKKTHKKAEEWCKSLSNHQKENVYRAYE